MINDIKVFCSDSLDMSLRHPEIKTCVQALAESRAKATIAYAKFSGRCLEQKDFRSWPDRCQGFVKFVFSNGQEYAALSWASADDAAIDIEFLKAEHRSCGLSLFTVVLATTDGSGQYFTTEVGRDTM
jgi:hypothetical protein